MLFFHSENEASNPVVSHFPGGEAHLNIIENTGTPRSVMWLMNSDTMSDDLVTLGLWADYARQSGVDPIAFIPYLPAARADRGVPFGGKVYAGILNSFGFKKIYAIDPHSPVITELVDNLTVLDHTDVVVQATRLNQNRWDGLIAPDEGATERTLKIAEKVNLPVFQAKKHRDFATGKLSGFSCEKLPEGGRYLVIDDVCDGGGTFRGLAETTGVTKENLGLWVTHGVFSGKAADLRNHFGSIHCTTSHLGAFKTALKPTIHTLIPLFESTGDY